MTEGLLDRTRDAVGGLGPSRASAFFACVARYVAGISRSVELRQTARDLDVGDSYAELKDWLDHSPYVLRRLWRAAFLVARSLSVPEAARRAEVQEDDLHFVTDHLSRYDLQLLWLMDDGTADRPVVVLDEIVVEIQRYCTAAAPSYWQSVRRHDNAMDLHDVWSEMFCAGMAQALACRDADLGRVLRGAVRAARNRAIDLARRGRARPIDTDEPPEVAVSGRTEYVDLVLSAPDVRSRLATRRILEGENLDDVVAPSGRAELARALVRAAQE